MKGFDNIWKSVLNRALRYAHFRQLIISVSNVKSTWHWMHRISAVENVQNGGLKCWIGSIPDSGHLGGKSDADQTSIGADLRFSSDESVTLLDEDIRVYRDGHTFFLVDCVIPPPLLAASSRGGEFTQPSTHFIGHLCSLKWHFLKTTLTAPPRMSC